MSIIETRIYVLKRWLYKLPFSSYKRRITLVIRQKEWYDKPALAIWWKLRSGVNDGQNRKWKSLMIGISLIGLRAWVEFAYKVKSATTKKSFIIRDKSYEGGQCKIDVD